MYMLTHRNNAQKSEMVKHLRRQADSVEFFPRNLSGLLPSVFAVSNVSSELVFPQQPRKRDERVRIRANSSKTKDSTCNGSSNTPQLSFVVPPLGPA